LWREFQDFTISIARKGAKAAKAGFPSHFWRLCVRIVND
jgi:hypothetical protein